MRPVCRNWSTGTDETDQIRGVISVKTVNLGAMHPIRPGVSLYLLDCVIHAYRGKTADETLVQIQADTIEEVLDAEHRVRVTFRHTNFLTPIRDAEGGWIIVGRVYEPVDFSDEPCPPQAGMYSIREECPCVYRGETNAP